jgi:SET domain-containing protein
LFDQQRGVKPNAALLPVSDNTTGKVYVAVVALRDIAVASGEDICIDYGLAYWRSRRDMERMLQASWVL